MNSGDFTIAKIAQEGEAVDQQLRQKLDHEHREDQPVKRHEQAAKRRDCFGHGLKAERHRIHQDERRDEELEAPRFDQ